MKSKKLITALAGLWIIPIAAPAQIFIGPSLENYDSNSGTAINTVSFEVPAGTDRTLVVAITSEDADSVQSITYGSQSFTKGVSTNTTRISEIWYLDNPEIKCCVSI